ncbi:hypothetical protein KCU88_g5630, partial [Aureobasidium melanogenum]
MNTQQLASYTGTLLGIAATAAGLRAVLRPKEFAASFGLPVDVGVNDIGNGQQHRGSCSRSYFPAHVDHQHAITVTWTGEKEDLNDATNGHRLALPSAPVQGSLPPQETEKDGNNNNPFIPLVGVRTLAVAFCLFVFSTQQNLHAAGVVLLCNMVSMLGDVLICYRQGTAGSTRSHVVAALVFGGLGGFMALQ